MTPKEEGTERAVLGAELAILGIAVDALAAKLRATRAQVDKLTAENTELRAQCFAMARELMQLRGTRPAKEHEHLYAAFNVKP